MLRLYYNYEIIKITKNAISSWSENVDGFDRWVVVVLRGLGVVVVVVVVVGFGVVVVVVGFGVVVVVVVVVVGLAVVVVVVLVVLTFGLLAWFDAGSKIFANSS